MGVKVDESGEGDQAEQSTSRPVWSRGDQAVDDAEVLGFATEEADVLEDHWFAQRKTGPSRQIRGASLPLLRWPLEQP